MPNAHDENLIHLWLGRNHGGVQKIVVCAPFHPDIGEITCELSVGKKAVRSQTCSCRDEVIRLFEFSFDDLKPGQLYRYSLTSGGKELRLGRGLKPSDLFFTYWDKLDDSDLIALVSCNGIFGFSDPGFNRWGMWARLRLEIERMIPRPKLLILGGDQYYQDAIEDRWMLRIMREPFESIYEEFKRDSLANALEHFSHPSYRKIMAQIPSVAMLDDHDITDGAGGRDDYFIGKEFVEEWVRYRDVQLEIFGALQGSRNPEPVLRVPDRAFSFVMDLGSSALVALDLRSEKNSRKRKLMESDHLTAVLEAMERLPHKNVMILNPLIPIRYDQKREKRLVRVAHVIRSILPNVNPRGADAFDELRGLDDDLADVLTSPENMPFFTKLLHAMNRGAVKGVQYTVLSGDIHTGGSVEVQARVGESAFRFPIFVSSPIGSKPMSSWLEWVSRERGHFEVDHEDVSLRARNHAFVTRRNFLVIRPSQLVPAAKGIAAFIFEEGKPGCHDVLMRYRFPTVPELERLVGRAAGLSGRLNIKKSKKRARRAAQTEAALRP